MGTRYCVFNLFYDFILLKICLNVLLLYRHANVIFMAIFVYV